MVHTTRYPVPNELVEYIEKAKKEQEVEWRVRIPKGIFMRKFVKIQIIKMPRQLKNAIKR